MKSTKWLRDRIQWVRFRYAMISNIALASDGIDAVHVMSEPYLAYAPEEAQRKIRHALEQINRTPAGIFGDISDMIVRQRATA